MRSVIPEPALLGDHSRQSHVFPAVSCLPDLAKGSTKTRVGVGGWGGGGRQVPNKETFTLSSFPFVSIFSFNTE